jgi:hypothetical protein
MLLDDIINLATDDKQSIVVLLRKCLVLAHRLKNAQLTSWVNKELNGYGEHNAVPDYRKTPAPSEGLFIGPGWSQLTYPIPPSSLDERHRQFAQEVHLAQGISAYEQLIREGKDGKVAIFGLPTLLPTIETAFSNRGICILPARRFQDPLLSSCWTP